MGPSTYHQFWNLVYPSITSPTHHYAQLQRVPLYLLPLGRGPSNARAPTPSPPIATIPMSLQCYTLKDHKHNHNRRTQSQRQTRDSPKPAIPTIEHAPEPHARVSQAENQHTKFNIRQSCQIK